MWRIAAVLYAAALVTATTDRRNEEFVAQGPAEAWDSVAFVQNKRQSRQTQEGSILQGEQGTTATTGLQRMMDDKDVKQCMARHTPAYPPSEEAMQGTKDAMEKFMADAAEQQRQGEDSRGKVAPMLEPLGPLAANDESDLEVVLTEIKAALKGGKLIPSHTEAMSMLETAIKQQAPDALSSISPEVLEEQVKHWRKATEVWRDDEYVHDELLMAARKMYALRRQTELFKPLQAAAAEYKKAEDHKEKNITALLQLGKHVQSLEQSATDALRFMGMNAAGQEGTEGAEEGTEEQQAASETWDPYLRIASHWGPSWEPRCKLGTRVTLTAGFKNHIYMKERYKKKKKDGLWETLKQTIHPGWQVYVLRLGMYFPTEKGLILGFQFQIEWSPRDQVKAITPKRMALTFRLAEMGKPNATELQCKNKWDLEPRFHGNILLGPGVQCNSPKAGSTFFDAHPVFDFMTGQAENDKYLNGWTFSWMDRLGLKLKNGLMVILFHKIRFHPTKALRYFDLRFRMFLETQSSPDLTKEYKIHRKGINE
mmetsp:Transcript_57544/g.129728  ORF Transcript_57544/g.129728 Transcript_57544/m.129728 type:complete len:539 (-) Transcript_57544:186-1802(-)